MFPVGEVNKVRSTTGPSIYGGASSPLDAVLGADELGVGVEEVGSFPGAVDPKSGGVVVTVTVTVGAGVVPETSPPQAVNRSRMGTAREAATKRRHWRRNS